MTVPSPIAHPSAGPSSPSPSVPSAQRQGAPNPPGGTGKRWAESLVLPVARALKRSDHATVRVDLHMHTSASVDCAVPPTLMVEGCRTLGLQPIFVTDHDTLDGWLHLKDRRDARVVGGQEITTRDGELIGLFVEHPVEPGAPATETARHIKRQGGIVYLPHPLDPTRNSLTAESIDRIVDAIDVVEIFNARAPSEINLNAEKLCHALGAIPGAGSDAHTKRELGSVYVEMEAFAGPEDFLRKLARARIVRRTPLTPLASTLSSAWYGLTRRRAAQHTGATDR